ncbi:hypothetical protein JW916_15760 [Candidatus Sumerlaeota bacterium]|nr:hypothetical protein [Candidatus Sumerlaeota bacterium]
MRSILRNDTSKELAALGLAICLASIAVRQFFFLSDWDTHDCDMYMLRQAALVAAMGDGQWMGRWCSVLDFGYGYPLFRYYGPGLYFLGAGFYALGLGIAESVKTAMVFLALIGVGGMYGLGRIFCGRLAAATGAIVWAFTPYLQVDLFVRGAFGEYAALQWLPVAACLYLWGIERGRFSIVLFGAIAHACLIVSHAPVALCATPLLLALTLWSGLRRYRRFDWRALAGIGAAIALSAFYWLPAVADRNLIHETRLFLGGAHSDHFVHLSQMLKVFFWGYGGSGPGRRHDGMTFSVGLAQVVLISLAWLFLLVRGRRGGKAPWPLVAGTVLGLATLFPILSPSKRLWEMLPIVQYLQFPWRLLGPAGFFLAWAAGGALELLSRRIASAGRRFALFAVAALFVSACPPWHWEKAREQLPVVSGRPTDDFLRSRSWSPAGGDEYLPAAVDTVEKFRSQYPPWQARPMTAHGMAEMKKSRPGSWQIDLDLDRRDSVVVGIYWFPGWRLETDGRRVATWPKRKYGLIVFGAPAGRSRFTLRRERTWTEILGDGVSTTAALGVLTAFGLGRFRRRVRMRPKEAPPVAEP